MTKILIDRSTLASAQEALAELLPDERDTNCDGHDARDVRWWRAVEKALRAALAEPVLQTCNCRWDGETQVQQCTLHEAHVDAIHEWAERAKTAEKKLAALAEPVQEPDSAERRCGGPGCDMKCCQPVQEPVAGVVLNEEGRAALVEHGREEWHCVVRNARRLYAAPLQRPAEPQGCAHCNHPLYAAVKCKVCGRAHKIGGEE